ncbi:hypothetical protein [Mycolicibacterium porcinum]|uniref:hypothetical protein n=1 Tax=Mycolicibacterium porcinum TaxID=39693 RepID=UPI001041D94B|nr:hypothetical protein [Mycolicibacterium porcinum]
MENHIPAEPNPFLTQWLLSGDCASVLRQGGGLLLGVWQGIVAHQTGALAESGKIGEPFIGGEDHDRLVLEVTSGEGTPRGGYGAAREFGIGIHPESEQPPTMWMPQDPADDWVKALAIVNAMP